MPVAQSFPWRWITEWEFQRMGLRQAWSAAHGPPDWWRRPTRFDSSWKAWRMFWTVTFFFSCRDKHPRYFWGEQKVCFVHFSNWRTQKQVLIMWTVPLNVQIKGCESFFPIVSFSYYCGKATLKERLSFLFSRKRLKPQESTKTNYFIEKLIQKRSTCENFVIFHKLLLFP